MAIQIINGGKAFNAYGRINSVRTTFGKRSVGDNEVSNIINTSKVMIPGFHGRGCNIKNIAAPVTATMYVEDSDPVLNNTTDKSTAAR